ncbi:MAG: DNA ligase D [Bdellovibrionales bacterium]|nr:DNA ligase D [Bdellovibrionales bacterium]
MNALEPFCAPQLAQLASSVPTGSDWLYEIKLDGYRLLARIDSGDVHLLTRNGHDWSDRFPEICADLERLPVRTALLDGEAVVVLPDGRSDFQELQHRLGRRGGRAAVGVQYHVFDLIHLDGEDLREHPLERRKERLIEILGEGQWQTVRICDYFIGDGALFFEESCRRGLEGVIAKRRSAPYRSVRSRDWQKIKCGRRQEFVVGGLTRLKGRDAVGALLLGVYHEGHLLFCGKVGTGFSDRARRELYLELIPHQCAASPFRSIPRERQVVWLHPQAVAEVSFTQWTNDHRLRHPVFHGLRSDKAANTIVRESPMKQSKPKRGKARTSRRHEVSDSSVRFTHPDRVVFPEQGLTKLALAEYYEAVADRILTHDSHRPLTLVRCPAGRAGKCFFQKHATGSMPDALPRAAVSEDLKEEPYLYLESEAHLLWLVQLNVLEIHVGNSRIEQLEQPDRIVIDLDPDPAVPSSAVVSAAFLVKEAMEHLGLVPFVRMTGGKGLHVVTPIRPKLGWDEVKAFSAALSKVVAAAQPDRFVTVMTKKKRSGKIFIDYLRNGRGATAIAGYSTRARAGAPVAVPLRWDEVASRFGRTAYTVANVPRRLASLKEDPWEGYFDSERPITRQMIRAVGM